MHLNIIKIDNLNYEAIVFFCFFSLCNGISSAVTQQHFYDCVINTFYYNDLNEAVNPTVNYAYMCEGMLGLDEFPAQLLCNDFGDVALIDFIGTDCTVLCENGYAAGSDRWVY